MISVILGRVKRQVETRADAHLEHPAAGRRNDPLSVADQFAVVHRERDEVWDDMVAVEAHCPAVSGCHVAAALGATTAGVDAFLHVADLLAGLDALLADLSALATGMLVVGRVDQHEVSRGPADLGAGHHEAECSGSTCLPPCSRQCVIAMPRQVW